MTKNTKAITKPFNPYTDLKWFKEIFIHDDKVVGERFQLKGRSPGETEFYAIHEADNKTRVLDDLASLRFFSGVTLRPGVKEQIEEMKEEDDD